MNDINTAFTGSIPQDYDRYLGPMFFHCCARDLVGRAARQPVRRALEVAAGTGILTRLLRDRLPADTGIVATDLNVDMLAHARGKFGADENIRFQVADAQALPFDDGTFDLALCQFGIMFCPDKLRALTEARRVLTAGGRLLFSVWNGLDDNALPRTVNAILDELFAGDAPAFLQVPFSYHEQDRLRADLEAAGFGSVDLVTLDGECRFADPRQAALGMVTGSPLGVEIGQRGDIDIETVVEQVSRGIAAAFGDSDCRVPMRWTVMQAHKDDASPQP